ncbi:sigma-70 family RNA polymerase sigma factor [Actinoplanes sp. NPDC051470]|uniref:RNA polymerase sigma factor n=1 Tax=Actinoplanes sp. NPDC051470 TaxID=3157224 RepID=UPI0034287EB7
MTDADLVRAARAGDAASLGVLLGRHRAGMYAVALGILGAGPDAEDAVQDAALIAVGRLGDLRDPAAAGAWLRGIVRNTSRALRRRDRCVPTDLPDRAGPGPGPEELLDRLALRDWVWRALDELSPPLRLVTMLRYFTGFDDYETIAQACDVPVGTVRSRLSQARVKLTGALRATAETAGADDLAAVTASRRKQAYDLVDGLERGDFAGMPEVFHPEVESRWPSGRTGRDIGDLVHVITKDLSEGVRHPLRSVVAGRDVLIWENDLISPPWDPEHCPPASAWVQTLRDGRVARVRVIHRPRSNFPPAAPHL